jgi:hypothetical protein
MGITYDGAYERFHGAWNAGNVVIVATLAEGPWAGRDLICITPRDELKRGVKRCRHRRSASDQAFMGSLREAIVEQVHHGIGKLTPANDHDLMDDLTILMAVKLAAGGRESVLDGTGLFSLRLLVSPDTEVPWTARGFLTAADAQRVLPPS